jgi:predicted short-subunit dehydrogenase-like oxidoreductase (DUF2520 family)
MQDDDPSASPVAVVGAGAVGTALARRLADCDYPVRAILSHSEASARALAERVGAAVGTNEVAALPAEVRLVLICVPDDAIEAVASDLAAVDHPWSHTIVGHTSGARTADALAPLAEQGAAPFSFHPLQTFPSGTSPEAFEDIAITVEGDPDAVLAGKVLARTLGARPVVLSARDKARVHCAAALASNGLVVLMAVVEEVLPEMDLDGDNRSADLLAPLVERTFTNMQEAPPESVLTGPVARGDRDTLEAHLAALSEETPHLVPLYAALSTEMVRVAVRSGKLDGKTAEDLLHLLQKALPGSADNIDPGLSH